MDKTGFSFLRNRRAEMTRKREDRPQREQRHSKLSSCRLALTSSCSSRSARQRGAEDMRVPLRLLREAGWRDLSVPPLELRPRRCLTTGGFCTYHKREFSSFPNREKVNMCFRMCVYAYCVDRCASVRTLEYIERIRAWACLSFVVRLCTLSL